MPDHMYLENLDEFINDENKVVTYKWLSSTLKVHVNQAKQMLFSFIQEQRKKNNDINVTYFVSGVKKQNGCATCRCSIVPEDRLESYKKTLSPLTSCHIYSVQKSKLKNSDALYITDYTETKKNILCCNKYSSIQYNKAKARSVNEINKLRAEQKGAGDAEKIVESKTNTDTSKNVPNKTEASKKTNKAGIAGMFANASKKQENKPAVKEEKVSPRKTEEKTKSKAGTVSDLFSKQRGKNTEKPSPTITETKVEAEVKKEPTKNKPAKKKKLEESDADGGQKSKRRRIKEDLFDSSSDEDIEMEESPVPSPVREPSPCPESPIPEPKEEKTVSPVKNSSDDSTKVINSEKKRRRKRKLVPKTYMDEEGFMVTEKVWESESTDASDEEVPKTEPVKAPQKSPAKLPPGKKAPAKKKSPVKASGKQMNMMSFFKKK